MYTEIIDLSGNRLALLVRGAFAPSGVQFLSDSMDTQQLAYMSRPKGEYIAAHSHLEFPRQISGTSEVLIMRKGSMRVDLFASSRDYVGSVTMRSGDVIVLMNGGHGFELLEDVDFIEIKQGPYVDGKDKERFMPDPFDIRNLDV